jgi:hypothetical protein
MHERKLLGAIHYIDSFTPDHVHEVVIGGDNHPSMRFKALLLRLKGTQTSGTARSHASNGNVTLEWIPVRGNPVQLGKISIARVAILSSAKNGYAYAASDATTFDWQLKLSLDHSGRNALDTRFGKLRVTFDDIKTIATFLTGVWTVDAELEDAPMEYLPGYFTNAYDMGGTKVYSIPERNVASILMQLAAGATVMTTIGIRQNDRTIRHTRTTWDDLRYQTMMTYELEAAPSENFAIVDFARNSLAESIGIVTFDREGGAGNVEYVALAPIFVGEQISAVTRQAVVANLGSRASALAAAKQSAK